MTGPGCQYGETITCDTHRTLRADTAELYWIVSSTQYFTNRKNMLSFRRHKIRIQSEII